jgi:spore germination protein YaaH
MKCRIGFTLSLLLLVTLVSQPLQAADKEPRKILSGWIPYYSVKTVLPLVRKLPSAIPNVAGQPSICDASQYGPAENQAIESSYLFTNKDLMKEVMPFWYSLKSPTVIRDDYVSGNPSWPIADTVCLMRRAGLQVIPTMTDGTDKLVLSGYLSNPTTRTTIVNTIVDLVMKNNFDGIDLDYEGFAFVDGNNTWTKTAPRWVALVKELSVALHARNKLLSVSTPYLYDPQDKQKGYFVYAWADIASSIDRLRIMTYDYSVAKPGPMGPLAWTEKTIQYAISVMSPSKVYVGLPGYGRDWITSVKGKCPTSAPPGLIAGAKAATFKMNYAAAKAAIDGAIPTFNEQYSEATYSYTQSYNGLSSTGAATACTVNRTVWFQNARSFADRMALVAKYRLGGAAMWTLGMEEMAATNEIRTAALAIAPDPVVNTISLENVTDGSINYGGTFTVKGLITLKDKTPIAGLNVAFEIKRPNESEWTKIADLVAAADGTVTTAMTLGGDASIRLTTDGTWERAASVSAEEKISVKNLLQIDRPVSAAKGSVFTIKAQLLPKLVGKTANLQKNISGKWQNVGVATVSDTNGSFTFTSSETKRGVVTLRVQVTGDIASAPFAIVIR